jgi:hypothetical protein
VKESCFKKLPEANNESVDNDKKLFDFFKALEDEKRKPL